MRIYWWPNNQDSLLTKIMQLHGNMFSSMSPDFPEIDTHTLNHRNAYKGNINLNK